MFILLHLLSKGCLCCCCTKYRCCFSSFRIWTTLLALQELGVKTSLRTLKKSMRPTTNLRTGLQRKTTLANPSTLTQVVGQCCHLFLFFNNNNKVCIVWLQMNKAKWSEVKLIHYAAILPSFCVLSVTGLKLA